MSLPLFEGAVIAILRNNNGDFGLQRLYANIGTVVMTPISGVLIDVISSKSGTDNFRYLSYFS